jgi:hypothetical protein
MAKAKPMSTSILPLHDRLGIQLLMESGGFSATLHTLHSKKSVSEIIANSGSTSTKEAKNHAIDGFYD